MRARKFWEVIVQTWIKGDSFCASHQDPHCRIGAVKLICGRRTFVKRSLKILLKNVFVPKSLAIILKCK